MLCCLNVFEFESQMTQSLSVNNKLQHQQKFPKTMIQQLLQFKHFLLAVSLLEIFCLLLKIGKFFT